jgi:hypothetical protein
MRGEDDDNADEVELTDDEDCVADESSEAAALSLDGSKHLDHAAVAGQSAGIEIMGRRFRGQRKAATLITKFAARSKIRRMIAMPDGSLAYSDEVEQLLLLSLQRRVVKPLDLV